MPEIDHEFGERLESATQRAGIAKKELAEAVGMEPSSISRYFAGRVPVGNKLLKLAKRLNVSCDWLLSGEGPMDRSHKPASPMMGPGKLTKQEEELLGKALEVLRSKKTKGAFDQALKSSIEAFHAAIKIAE